jgi:transmembrane sensor
MEGSERKAQVSVEAADWWVRLQLEAESQTTREQYFDWLRQSPLHIAEMLRMGKVHGLIGKYPQWRATATSPGAEETDNVVPLTAVAGNRASPGQSRRYRIGGIAAIFALVLIGSLWLWAPWRGQILGTERGERREVTLDEGSVVQLDPQTRLRIKFGEESRTVVLEKGRAVFRVTEDAQRPFRVNADGASIRAIGTAFGVDRSHRDVIVTVMEGKVAVTLDSLPSRLETLTVSRVVPTVLLTENQQVRVASSGAVQAVRNVDSNRELAWAQGRLIFENDSVADVVESFNRYNRIQLHVSDPALAARPVSGIFNASAPDSFVRFLGTVADVKVVRDGDQDVTIASTEK